MPMKFLCLSSFQGSGKKCDTVKKMFHSRSTKPNCKSDLAGYPKILAYKLEWNHSSNRVQNFWQPGLVQGCQYLGSAEISVKGCVCMCLLSSPQPTGLLQILRGLSCQAMGPRHANRFLGSTGKERESDVQSVILPKYLWHQQTLYNDNSYLIPPI